MQGGCVRRCIMRLQESGIFPKNSLSTPGERRGSARTPVSCLVSAVFGGRRHIYRLADISRSGARLERDSVLRPKRVHRMEIHCGDAEPLQLLVQVVRSTKHSHAVRFLALDDMDRLELAEVIDALHCAA